MSKKAIGILDLRRVTREAETSGGVVVVSAVSMAGIADLLVKHALVRKLFRGEVTNADFTPETLLGFAPDFAVDCITLGVDGGPEVREHVASLSVSDQLSLFEAVTSASMPEGIGPFVEKVTRLLRVASDNGIKA